MCGLINYGCPLDEDIYVNGRQGRRKNWIIISECSIRDISNIICKITFSETKITTTEFLTIGYVSLIVLSFLEISDSY